MSNLTLSENEKVVLIGIGDKEVRALTPLNMIKKYFGTSINIDIYFILDQLEKKGLVRSRWGDDLSTERGKARNRLYSLTDQGYLVFEQIIISNFVDFNFSYCV